MSKRLMTPVFDGAKDLPFRPGWYNAWLKGTNRGLSEEEKRQRRRYWNGRCFSSVVFVGAATTEAQRCQSLPTGHSSDEFYWRGLLSPTDT